MNERNYCNEITIRDNRLRFRFYGSLAPHRTRNIDALFGRMGSFSMFRARYWTVSVAIRTGENPKRKVAISYRSAALELISHPATAAHALFAVRRRCTLRWVVAQVFHAREWLAVYGVARLMHMGKGRQNVRKRNIVFIHCFVGFGVLFLDLYFI